MNLDNNFPKALKIFYLNYTQSYFIYLQKIKKNEDNNTISFINEWWIYICETMIHEFVVYQNKIFLYLKWKKISGPKI